MVRQRSWKWLGLIGILVGGMGALASVLVRQRRHRQQIY